MAEPPVSSDDSADRDWPAQIADTAVRVIEQIRDKTTRPAITIARGLVFGLMALTVGTVAVFLLLIGSHILFLWRLLFLVLSFCFGSFDRQLFLSNVIYMIRCICTWLRYICVH